MAGVLSCGLAGWVRGSGPVGVAHGGCPFVWAGGLGAGVRSSWCRAWRCPFVWAGGLGGGGQVQLVSRMAVSFRAGWRAGWSGSGPVGVAHGGLLSCGLAGWVVGVRSSWCRAWRCPFVWAGGLGGGGQVQLVSRMAGCPFVRAGGLGGGGQVQLVSRMAGVLSCGLAGWVVGVRSSWCRAWRVSFRVGWRAGCGGQVQLVSRMAGVLSCGLAGWVVGVRSSWCRASRSPVRVGGRPERGLGKGRALCWIGPGHVKHAGKSL